MKGGKGMTEDTFEEESQFHGTALCSPEEPAPAQRGSYLGSVRFFKHLILTVLALMIVIPTVLSVVLGVALGTTRTQLTALRLQISQLQSRTPQEEEPPARNGVAAEEDAFHGVAAEEDAFHGGAAEEDAFQHESPEPEEGLIPEVPAYQDLYPELYAQPVERGCVYEEKVVYLTFDDGPSERTPELLEVLDYYGVKATFFVVGGESERCQQWMRDIVAAGHTIGVHSYTHSYPTIYHSVEAFLEDFAQEYNLIQNATGVSPQIFRFPGGSINAYNGSNYQEIISEMTRRGFVYFDWNRQTGDAVQSAVPAQTLAANALDQSACMHRVILLAHDSARFTNVVEALPGIIEGYRAEGFSFAALTPEVRPIVFNYPV